MVLVDLRIFRVKADRKGRKGEVGLSLRANGTVTAVPIDVNAAGGTMLSKKAEARKTEKLKGNLESLRVEDYVNGILGLRFLPHESCEEECRREIQQDEAEKFFTRQERWSRTKFYRG